MKAKTVEVHKDLRVVDSSTTELLFESSNFANVERLMSLKSKDDIINTYWIRRT